MIVIVIFFASSLFKSVTIYGLTRMGQNFDDYPDFQKNQRGVKNYEKQCNSFNLVNTMSQLT